MVLTHRKPTDPENLEQRVTSLTVLGNKMGFVNAQQYLIGETDRLYGALMGEEVPELPVYTTPQVQATQQPLYKAPSQDYQA